jgi:hypothetical protein
MVNIQLKNLLMQEFGTVAIVGRLTNNYLTNDSQPTRIHYEAKEITTLV